MAFDQDGILSPEDEVLFGTSVNNMRKKLDRSTMLFIAALIGISMLAGFCGGIIPVALSSRCEVADTSW
jgi:hypothetical protein